MVIQISFEYTRGKVMQALRYHFLSRPEIKVSAIIVVVFSLISGVFLFLKKIQPQVFLLFSIVWLAFFIMVFYLMPYLVYQQAKRVFSAKYHAYFAPQYFCIENEAGRNEWTWDRFSNYFESPNFIHLYFSKRSFFLIPKEQISQENLKNIRVLLSKNISIGKF